MQNSRVLVSLHDFFTFSSYPGGDPETATYGSRLMDPCSKLFSYNREIKDCGTDRKLGQDYGSYPVSKKILFGISIRF